MGSALITSYFFAASAALLYHMRGIVVGLSLDSLGAGHAVWLEGKWDALPQYIRCDPGTQKRLLLPA